MKALVKIQGGERDEITVDADRLASDLRQQTTAEVRFDHGSRALYATAGETTGKFLLVWWSLERKRT